MSALCPLPTCCDSAPPTTEAWVGHADVHSLGKVRQRGGTHVRTQTKRCTEGGGGGCFACSRNMIVNWGSDLCVSAGVKPVGSVNS